jgi:hypothetical protein
VVGLREPPVEIYLHWWFITASRNVFTILFHTVVVMESLLRWDNSWDLPELIKWCGRLCRSEQIYTTQRAVFLRQFLLKLNFNSLFTEYAPLTMALYWLYAVAEARIFLFSKKLWHYTSMNLFSDKKPPQEHIRNSGSKSCPSCEILATIDFFSGCLALCKYVYM